ncbi:LAFA_0C04104g1_1 [Lachancea sp. 'fantastica']|nr:LAFA_0C04104g1_1 [Lachancea sp. 'fantastica']
MQSGALIQHGAFQELQNMTALPRIKVFQKGSRVRPSLPSIRQLLRDINLRSSENNCPAHTNSKAPIQAHVYSSVSPAETNSSKKFTRLSHNNDDHYSAAVSGAPGSLTATQHVGKVSSENQAQFVPLQPNRLAPCPPVFPSKANRPSGELLKLAYIVESSSPDASKNTNDSITQLNKDYQLKIAETLDSLQTLYRHMQEWPLSLHTQDMEDHDEFALLIDYVSSDSLQLTIKMARRAFESLKSIEQWKSKYKKLHPSIPASRPGKVIKRDNSPRMKDIAKRKRRQFEFLKSRKMDSRKPLVSAGSEPSEAVKNTSQGKSRASLEPADSSSSEGLQCAHCSTTTTPEWRKGPYGKRSLCNACGLFYKKLIRKFGDSQGGRIMKYRKGILSNDRKVPRVFDVPDSY